MTDLDLDDLQDPPRLDAGPVPRQRRFRKVPVRYILPNMITLVALCLGLTAIRFAVEVTTPFSLEIRASTRV